MPYSNPEKAKAYKHEHYIRNKEKISRQSKEYYQRNKERTKKKNRENYLVDLAKQYKVSVEHLIELRSKNICAICGSKDRPMHIDHDHETGTIRDLLCQPCNRALGLFGDSLEVLEAALAYLVKHGKKKLV